MAAAIKQTISAILANFRTEPSPNEAEGYTELP
jgi:hypothetical protein